MMRSLNRRKTSYSLKKFYPEPPVTNHRSSRPVRIENKSPESACRHFRGMIVCFNNNSERTGWPAHVDIGLSYIVIVIESRSG